MDIEILRQQYENGLKSKNENKIKLIDKILNLYPLSGMLTRKYEHLLKIKKYIERE